MDSKLYSIKIIVYAIVILQIITFTPIISKEQEGEEAYTFALFLEPFKDESSKNTQVELIKSIVEFISKKFNKRVRLSIIPSRDELLKMVENGDVDLAVVKPDEYVNLKEKGSKILPLFSFSNGDKKWKFCMCIMRTSENKTLKDLSGKKVYWSPYLIDYISLRETLGDLGINIPPEKYFQANLKIKTIRDAFFMLLDNEVDAVWGLTDNKIFTFPLDKRFQDVVPIFCSKEYPPKLFVYKNTIPNEVIIPLRKSLSNIRKDPDAAKFKFAFVAFDVQFTPVEDADFNELRELLKKAKKDNWIKDFEKWVKTQK